MVLLSCMVSKCLTLIRNWWTVFQSGCSILHFHQQTRSVPIASYSWQHLLILVFFSHSSGCELVYHCTFNLYFPADLRYRILLNKFKILIKSNLSFFSFFVGAFCVLPQKNLYLLQGQTQSMFLPASFCFWALHLDLWFTCVRVWKVKGWGSSYLIVIQLFHQ